MKKILLLIILCGCCISCVKDEVYRGPSIIEAVSYFPKDVTSQDEVTVNAIIKDLLGVQKALVIYTIHGKSEELSMKLENNDSYQAIIPKQVNNTKVEFIVSVVNTSNIKTDSKKFVYMVSDKVIDYSKIVLNEIDGNSKSIELFNKGDEELSLEGFYLVKNNEGEWWRGTVESGKIAPGQYVVITQNNSENSGLSGNSGISAKQMLKFDLFAPNSDVIGTFLRGDEQNLGSKASDIAPHSYQICPNGEGEWKIANPTIGSKNPKKGDEIPQK